MALSWRHHYVPQFHLRGFTDDAGLFFVYDKVRKKLKRGRYSPASHFFQRNRNLTLAHGVWSDFVEKLYASYDNVAAQVFEDIRSRDSRITLKMIQHLKLYISMLFWRLPSSDGIVDAAVSSLGAAGLGLQVRDKSTGEVVDVPWLNERLVADPSFRKAVRFLILPLRTFDTHIKEADSRNWGVYHAAAAPVVHVCSDNPIVFQQLPTGFNFESAIVFPLSSASFAYYTPNGVVPREMQPTVRVELDSFLFRQANEFVCGPNSAYLESLADLTRQAEEHWTLEKHRQYLFQLLESGKAPRTLGVHGAG